jgi:hypothetical protein
MSVTPIADLAIHFPSETSDAELATLRDALDGTSGLKNVSWHRTDVGTGVCFSITTGSRASLALTLF